MKKDSNYDQYKNSKSNCHIQFLLTGVLFVGLIDLSRALFASQPAEWVDKMAVSGDMPCFGVLIVHHGLFWKFHGVRTLTGPFGKRVIQKTETPMKSTRLHRNILLQRVFQY